MAAQISIIIPTRHRPDYLDITIRSILTSVAECRVAHGVDSEVIVVDDAPENDDTRHVAELHGVRYLRVTEHDGRNDPGAAIVLGVQNVDTAYQTIFGDDDIMLPRHLVLAWEELQKGNDVVSSSLLVTDARLRTTHTRILRPANLGDLLAGYNWINDGSFVRHELVADLDWDVSLEAHMLLPIWARLLLDDRSFGLVEEPTWLYRQHGANISREALSDRDRALRAHVRELIAQETVVRLGEIPASPFKKHLEAQAADEEAQRQRKEAQRARRQQIERSAVLRARRRLARKIRP